MRRESFNLFIDEQFSSSSEVGSFVRRERFSLLYEQFSSSLVYEMRAVKGSACRMKRLFYHQPPDKLVSAASKACQQQQ